MDVMGIGSVIVVTGPVYNGLVLGLIQSSPKPLSQLV